MCDVCRYWILPAPRRKRNVFRKNGWPESIPAAAPNDRLYAISRKNTNPSESASAKASGFVTGADIKVDGGFLCQTI